MDRVIYYVIMIVFLVASVIPFYLMSKMANYKYPYFSFIPFLNIVQMLGIANMSPWWIVVAFIPGLNIIFMYYLYYKYFSSYEGGVVLAVCLYGTSIATLIFPVIILMYPIFLWWFIKTTKGYVGTLYAR